jgi:tetratricopeptide (TPR) repeat protein
MLSMGLALLLAAQAAPAAAPSRPSAAAAVAEVPDRSAAYYEFLRGRRLEGEGEVEQAVEAYRRAARLDPVSAEIQAELAALYARQNRAEDAIAAAEAALRADPENAEAHWVLGTVYAALAQGNQDGPPEVGDSLDKAIAHLERARPSRRYDLGLSLALGRLYLRKSDYANAITQLKWLADQEPGAVEVAYLLAQAYDGAGRREEAITTLSAVTGQEPRHYRAWILLGELFEKERRFDEAASAYARAITQNPRNVELRLRQASALLNSGQTASARKLLQAVVQDAPTDGGALYLLADAERQLKEYDEAEATAKRLVALEPAQIRGHFALALVYESRREHQKVIDTLVPVVDASQASRNDSRLAPVYLRLGLAYQELGTFDRAVEVFERAKAAGGGDAVFDIYLTQALLAAGKADTALTSVRRARSAHPRDARFARLEADALARSGQVDEAIAVLESEIAQGGARADLQIGLAALCVQHERFDCAATALDRAERAFPDNVMVAFQRGAFFERQEKYDEAEAAFRLALSRDPLHGPSLNYLGYMFAERGRSLDEAVSLLKRALETDPWNGSYLDSLGWAYFMSGDLGEARRLLSLAAERLPLNSVVLDHLGDVLWKQGDREGAVGAWKRALAGDRDSVDPAAITTKIEKAGR